MKSKSDIIRSKLACGDTLGAISTASRFFDRSPETQLYKQAQSAANNPSFYRQLGKDPAAIINAALESLNRRFQ